MTPFSSSSLPQFGLTFSAVFGVIIYRITVSALMAMSPDPETKSNVRVTVMATAVIINLVVILILDEIYGAVALWLTELGEQNAGTLRTSAPGANATFPSLTSTISISLNN